MFLIEAGYAIVSCLDAVQAFAVYSLTAVFDFVSVYCILCCCFMNSRERQWRRIIFLCRYHMYGANIGKLELYLKEYDKNATLIWKQETSLPPSWLPAQIDIISDADYQVNCFKPFTRTKVFTSPKHVKNKIIRKSRQSFWAWSKNIDFM